MRKRWRVWRVAVVVVAEVVVAVCRREGRLDGRLGIGTVLEMSFL